VHTFPARVVRWTAVAFLLALAGVRQPSTALADVTTVDASRAPIVRISVRRGDVTVRTWERQAVQVDGDPSLSIERHPTHQEGGERSILIPEAQAKSVKGLLVLPPESFVSAALPAGERDLVSIRTTSSENVGNVTITIPSDSVFVFAHASKGDLELHDYRAGTFVGFAAHGRLALVNDGGTVFAQTGYGPLTVLDSNFDRLRARSLVGNLTFTHCTVRQIEVTSVDGSIVYDNGNFEAGLARFESMYGNVAVGSTSSAQLGGRTMAGGRVFTNFSTDTPVDSHAGETNAVIKGGGPVVTATSEMGNVFLYDGSLHNRAQMPAEWSAPARTLRRPGVRTKLGPLPTEEP